MFLWLGTKTEYLGHRFISLVAFVVFSVIYLQLSTISVKGGLKLN